MNIKLFTFLIAATLFTTAGWADNLDPATLHFGTGYGTGVCATGCAGHPNQVSGSGFDIYQNSGGAGPTALTATNPLLLLVALPNTAVGSVTASAIKSVTFYSDTSGSATKTVGTGVASANGSHIYENPSTNSYNFSNPGFNSSSGDVFSFLTLMPTFDKSNNFSNFTSTSGPSGLGDPGATSFTIYVFDIYGGTLNANGLIQINLNTPGLPTGSILAAYMQDNSAVPGTNYENPYTEAGFVNGGPPPPQVPEPSSMLLFGTGLSSVAFFLRRRGSHAVKS